MRYIIVSDIFGRTAALEKIASDISASSFIFDPYNSHYMDFENEGDAYTHFTSEIGLDKYAENLLHFLQSSQEKITLIGFSVGAAAIWNISQQKDLHNIAGAICFYGSQIRHHTQISPLFPIHLLFPATEDHFSVAPLITYLAGKEKLSISQTSYLHGFMNSHSRNFDKSGYIKMMQALSTLPSSTTYEDNSTIF